jgi:hypothetical protein
MKKGYVITEDALEYDDERYYQGESESYHVVTPIYLDLAKAQQKLYQLRYEFWKKNMLDMYYEDPHDWAEPEIIQELMELEPMATVEEGNVMVKGSDSNDEDSDDEDSVPDIGEFAKYVHTLFNKLSYESLSNIVKHVSSPYSVEGLVIED